MLLCWRLNPSSTQTRPITSQSQLSITMFPYSTLFNVLKLFERTSVWREQSICCVSLIFWVWFMPHALTRRRSRPPGGHQGAIKVRWLHVVHLYCNTPLVWHVFFLYSAGRETTSNRKQRNKECECNWRRETRNEQEKENQRFWRTGRVNCKTTGLLNGGWAAHSTLRLQASLKADSADDYYSAAASESGASRQSAGQSSLTPIKQLGITEHMQPDLLTVGGSESEAFVWRRCVRLTPALISERLLRLAELNGAY